MHVAQCMCKYVDIYISCIGQHHGITVVFCGCKSPAERLLELNLWPATPSKPTLAFTIELMRFAQMLILECYASLYDIIAFLKTTATKQLQVKFMYKYNYIYM